MKGELFLKENMELIDTLNDCLDEELAAVYQYMVHAEMCEYLQFKRLSYVIQKQAFVKMWHAKILIAHILSIGGVPKANRQSHFKFNDKVQDLDISNMHKYDLETEEKAIKSYNNSIRIAGDVEYNDTKVLLESLLQEDVAIRNWKKAQLIQIEKMGIESYLSQQIRNLYDGDGDCPGCHR